MKIIIAGGTGFIGSALVSYLQPQHDITVLGRSLTKITKQFGPAVTAMDWTQFNRDSAQSLSGIDVVINLCGESVAAHRWTQQQRDRLTHTRIQPTSTLAAACAQLGSSAPHLINASGISIYGLQTGQSPDFPPALSEDSPIAGESSDFLSELAKSWEANTLVANNAGVPVTLLRLGVVLAKQGGSLPMMAMPFQLGVGGLIGSGCQPLSWVSLVDVCRIIDFVICHRTLTGPINVVGVQSVQQAEFAHTVAWVLRRPAFFNLPASLVKLLFGQMGVELLLSGQNSIPNRLLNAGYEFTHPTLELCLRAIYR